MGQGTESMADANLEDQADYESRNYEREKRDQYHFKNKEKMKKQLFENKRAEVRATINCAYCNRALVKVNPDHGFCGKKYKIKGKSSCKDAFYNYTDDARRKHK